MLTIEDIEKILYSDEGFKYVSNLQYLRVITESYCFFIFDLHFTYYVDYNKLTKFGLLEAISSCCYRIDNKEISILPDKIQNIIHNSYIETELGNTVVVGNILKVMDKLSTMNRKHKLERLL